MPAYLNRFSLILILFFIIGSGAMSIARDSEIGSFKLELTGNVLAPSGIWPGGSVVQLYARNNLLYLIKNDCLLILELDTNGNLINRSQYVADHRITRGNISEEHAVIHNIANGDRRVIVLDISDPDKILEVGKFDFNAVPFFEYVSASESYLYLIRYLYGGSTVFIYVVDIQDPINPVFTDTLSIPVPYFEGVSVSEVFYKQDIMYLMLTGVDRVSPIGAIATIDVSEPGSPVLLLSYNTDGFANTAISTDNLYLPVRWSRGVRVLDISDPSFINEAGFINTMDVPLDVVVRDSIAVVSEGEDGLRILDISNYNQPSELATVPGDYIYRLERIDNTVFVQDLEKELKVLDISDPVSPMINGRLSFWNDFSGLAFYDDYALIPTRDGGLVIADISNVNGPIEVNSISVGGTAISCMINETTAFVTTVDSGVFVADIGYLPDVTIISRFETPGTPNEIVVRDSLAFIADGTTGLLILDISNLNMPTEIGRFDTPGNANAIQIKDSMVYLADGVNGFRIIDVTNPAAPLGIGYYETQGLAGDVFVEETVAFIADGPKGLRILDVSDIGNIFEIGLFDTPGIATGLNKQDTTIYLADGNSGVRVISVNDIANPLEYASFEPRQGNLSEIGFYNNSIFAVGSEALYSFSGEIITSIFEEDKIPVEDFILTQNYPNPFNPSTEIRFYINESSPIELNIFDVTGRHVKSLVNKQLPIGEYTFEWNGTNEAGRSVGSGVYFYQLRSEASVQTKKMILLR